MLSEAEIERRLPVWHAFADLFLDTRLPPAVYARIARALNASGYSKTELRRILDEEVAPAFAFNLLDVAGEWAMWEEAEVREIMLAWLSAGSPRAGLGWLKKRLLRRHLAREWTRLSSLLDQKEDLSGAA